MTRLAHAPELLTVDEARAVLRIGRRQMYAAVNAGEVPSIRLGRTIRIPRHALVDLIGAPAGEDPGGDVVAFPQEATG